MSPFPPRLRRSLRGGRALQGLLLAWAVLGGAAPAGLIHAASISSTEAPPASSTAVSIDELPLVQAEFRRSDGYRSRLAEILALSAASDARAATIAREAEAIEKIVESEQRRIELGRTAGKVEILGDRFLAQVARLREARAIEQALRLGEDDSVELNLEAIDLGDRLDELLDPAAKAAELLRDVEVPEGTDRDAVQARLASILASQRSERLVPLNAALRDATASLGRLDSSQRRLLAAIDQFRTFVLEHLLSLRVAGAADLEEFLQGVGIVPQLVRKTPWSEIVEAMHDPSGSIALGPMLGGVAIVVLLGLRRTASRILARTGQRIARPETDQFSETMKATLATLVLAAPFPVAIALLGVRFAAAQANDAFIAECYDAVRSEWTIIAALSFAVALTRGGGLAVAHLGWSPATATGVRRWAWLVLGVTVPLQLLAELSGFGLMTPLQEVAAVQSLFVAAALTWVVVAVMSLHPSRGLPADWLRRHPRSLLGQTRWAWYGAAILLAVVSLVSAWRGYLFAANLLFEKFASSLAAMLVVQLGLDLSRRWLQVTSRRIASEQLAGEPSTPTPVAAGAEEDGVLPPASAVDLDEIGVQTKRIFWSIGNTVLVLLLIGVWSELLPAFGAMRDTALWTVTREVASASGPVKQAVPIDLLDLLASLLTIALTFVIARNLPGLVELVLLPRLPLGAGARYAIVTLFRYLLAVVGMVIALHLLGVEWASVQWLVSAAVLGLSFGLGEIFKNLVSGVILLLEQPIRVGDRVTIGGITGKVVSIRMRATTLVDPDRREQVIPNSSFITGTVTNWTLNDAVIRKVIRIGVGMESDLRLVERVLLDLARRTPGVLPEPSPSVVLAEFGADSLGMELRFYLEVGSPHDAEHLLRLAIVEEFARRGIELPFPQRDLRLRSVDPAAAAALRGEPAPKS